MAEINGYHIIECTCADGAADSLALSELFNRFGDGYGSQLLTGANSGLRTFTIPFDKLTNFDLDTDEGKYIFRGRSYTRAQYIQNLFVYNKTTGKPLAVRSNVTNQIYLVRFDETEQSLTKKLTDVFSSQIKLVQVRLFDDSIYDVTKISNVWAALDAAYFEASGFGDNDAINDAVWFDYSGNAHHFGGGGLTLQTNEYNGLPVIRFNGLGGFFQRAEAVTVYEVFALIRFSEAAFTSYQGVVTGSGGGEVALVTSQSGTNFYNNLYEDYEYEKDGVAYAASAQSAPMQEFSVVHARFENGIYLSALQIGKDRGYFDRYGKFDLQYLIVCDGLVTEIEECEIFEFLLNREQAFIPSGLDGLVPEFLGDVEPPTVPTNLTLFQANPEDGIVEATFDDSTDNVEVAGYQLRINDGGDYINEIVDLPDGSGHIIILTDGELFIDVRARDTAGNFSAWSTPVGGNVEDGTFTEFVGETGNTYTGDLTAVDVYTGDLTSGNTYTGVI